MRANLNDRLNDPGPLEPWEVLAEEFKEAGNQLSDELEHLAGASYRDQGPEAEAAKRKAEELLFALFHTNPRTALCLSGGGVRSATLAIGVLEGLARAVFPVGHETVAAESRPVLPEFDFLSTVSGGGYAGAWFSAWAAKKQLANPSMDAVAEVTAELGARRSSTLEPEARPLLHLRKYAAFLNPKLGILSADTWTLVATVLRNMVLNWLILIPLLMAVVLLPAIYGELIASHVRDWICQSSLWAGLAFAAIATAYIVYHLPTFHGGGGPGERRFLALALAPLTLAALLLPLHWAWYVAHADNYPLQRFVSYGAGIHGAGTLLGILVLFGRRKIKAGARNFALALGGLIAAAASGVVAGWVTYLVSIYFTPLRPGALIHPGLFTCVAVPVILGAFLTAALLTVGLASKITFDQDREWWSRAGGWLLIILCGWILLSLLVIYGPHYLALWTTNGLGRIGAWMSTGGLGWFASYLGKSPKTSAGRGAAANGSNGPAASPARNILAQMLGPMFLSILVVLLADANGWLISLLPGVKNHLVSFLTSIIGQAGAWLVLMQAVDQPLVASLCWLLILLAIAVISSYWINVNRFSLHAMYRARLVRTYLGASTIDRDRSVDRFTNLSERDEVQMKDLPQKPLHVVNMALNLVGGHNLAWQQRKAETFTSTRLRTGSVRSLYQSTKTYGSALNHPGLTLGTAITISGAAASPNMGYHSSPIVTLVMMLFNARLGWWLANPGPKGKGLWEKDGPTYALPPIINEMLGRTSDDSWWVYLSDGGHFENLGLYEMVLRRCATIVVVDGSQDSTYTFEDLANAVRKIRVDLGIAVEFPNGIPIYGPRDPRNCYCAVGSIRYDLADGGAAKPGQLLYIKGCLNGTEPADVLQYASQYPDFPQQSTDQLWFNEAQFESHRRLGRHIIERLAANSAGHQNSPVDQLVKCAEAFIARPNKP